jgi:hypothetical protein
MGDVRMNLIERFTRDRASRFVWGLVALACALAFLFALRGEDRASARSLDGAASRSLVYANQVIAPLVEEKRDGLHLYYKTVYPSVQAGIFTDPQVAVVRVWGADGNLLFASDSVGRLAGQVHANGTWIQTVLEGRTYSQIVVEPYTASTTGTAPSDTTLFQTFTPLLVPDRIDSVGAVEVDYLYGSLRSGGAGAWVRLQLLLGGLFLVSVAMFVLSMRVPRTVPTGATSWRNRMERLRGGSTVEPSRVEPEAEAREVQVARVQAPEVSTRAPGADASAAGAPAAPNADAADPARVAELEEALASAEWELSKLKDEAGAHEATVAALETERGESEAHAEELSRRVAVLEAQLAGLATAKDVSEPGPIAAEPAAEAEDANTDVAAERDADTRTDVEPAVNGEAADPLSLLEARLTSAERRAVEAGDRVSQSSSDATDLRARLARTAARKKGIASLEGDEHPGGEDAPPND